jgi:hypothetical protein
MRDTFQITLYINDGIHVVLSTPKIRTKYSLALVVESYYILTMSNMHQVDFLDVIVRVSGNINIYKVLCTMSRILK